MTTHLPIDPVSGNNEEAPMEDPISTLDTVVFAQDLAQAAADMQATDLSLIDLRGLVAYTDGFVVCSGRNRRQVQAVAQSVRSLAKTKYGKHAQGVEGLSRGQWVLVDFGDIVVHIFETSMRGFYDLDGLWQEAPRWEGPTEQAEPAEPEEPHFF